MDLVECACVSILIHRRRKKKISKKFWIHPIVSERLLHGQFHTLHYELRQYPPKFFNYYRMSVSAFDELLQILGPCLTYSNTQMRECISPEERLSVTIR